MESTALFLCSGKDKVASMNLTQALLRGCFFCAIIGSINTSFRDMLIVRDEYRKNLTSVNLVGHGLASRLKKIVSVQRLAQNPTVFWEPSEIFKYRELSHYITGLNEVDSYEDRDWRDGRWRLALVDDEVPEGFTNKDVVFEYCKKQKYPNQYKVADHYGFDPNGVGIDFEFQRIPSKLKVEYGELFSQLQFTDHIVDQVQAFKNKHFEENTVSLHIRSWYDCVWRKPALFDLNTYAKLMTQYPDSKFFLSTDDVRVEEALVSAFGASRFITLPMEDEYEFHLLNLLLLAENKTIIGSLLSTYTEVAWWLGGATADVKIAYKDDLLQFMDTTYHI